MEKKNSSIAIVIGTKAELIKCMPLMLELQSQQKHYWFVHTGQHPVRQACKEFGVKEPDFILSKEPKISTKFWSKMSQNAFFWFIKMIFRIKKVLKKIKPKYVIYHGDTMSTAAASIASSKFLNSDKRWKNVHLEAGLRSGSLFEPFPEEISRRISDKFSDILLAVSERTKNNLEEENQSGRIVLIGNTIVDSAYIAKEKSKRRTPLKEKYALINIHRHENLNNEDRMKKIIEIISSVRIKALWPIHHNTAHYLKKYELLGHVKKMKNVQLTDLEDYFSFISLLSNCEYLITDGGSIQEESLVFKKPCVLLRERTERQEGLQTGINFLTKLNVRKSKNIIEMIEDGNVKAKGFKNPYGEKGVSKKILKMLE